jgi:hypothetical protein
MNSKKLEGYGKSRHNQKHTKEGEITKEFKSALKVKTYSKLKNKSMISALCEN